MFGASVERRLLKSRGISVIFSGGSPSPYHIRLKKAVKMPCPADPPQAVGVERFQLLHDSSNHYGNGHCAPDSDLHHPFAASKLVSQHLPPRNLSLNGSPQALNGSCALFPSLKAIPLASYYKLHRVPSLSSMTEQDSDDMETVQLPRRESTSEPPQERAMQNGLHNKTLEQVVRTPGRQPSPQPTHLSVPGSSQPKVLHEEGSGYVAPKFEGKDLQMEQGMEIMVTD